MADISVNQNETGMLLSALNMALNNSVLEATGNVLMSFETESISGLNFNQSYISGLLDFIKIKLQSSPHKEEKCRIETDKSEDLAISMTVSASFAFSWNRTNDPREVAISENPLA
ncbi:unnamed protein product [Peronospora belbahrii]|uniref:Uncharacterized protein n=1 Tax=Peronospora belbahrii TaxID=622444 RepID=A0ABN8CQJ9_9STRA|nr:unnamed protein product [Peronospora belbahrii]